MAEMPVLQLQSSVNFTSLIQTALGETGRHPPRFVNVSMDEDTVRGALENCFNATLLDQYIRGVVRNLTTLSAEERREIEGDPLVYIVAVLIFYSCGIVVLMINYMKRVSVAFQ